MTILHVTEPFASGIATFLEHLVTNLPEHRHIVLHGERLSAEKELEIKSRFPPATTFIRWKFAKREINPWLDLRALFTLRAALRIASFDVVHLHSSKAGFLGRLACTWLGLKAVIYTPHAAAFLRTDVSAAKRKFYSLLEAFGSKFNGLIVSCCREEQKEFEARSIRSRCVNNGTAITSIHKTYTREFVITGSGLLTAQKNPALFNRIAGHFRDNAFVRFVWMGDGALRDHLTSDNIEVTGWITRSQMNEYLSKTNLFLSTSAWEGLPYAVLEAMNAECCLLLTRTGGHRDLVTDNGALFITPEEAITFINQCLESSERIITFGKNSKQLCSAYFNVIDMALHYNMLYHESVR
jgi:glycosyltransferase involved in cell wall biosynthesis